MEIHRAVFGSFSSVILKRKEVCCVTRHTYLVIVWVILSSVRLVGRTQEYLFSARPCSTEQHIGKAEPKSDTKTQSEEKVFRDCVVTCNEEGR